MSPRLLRWTSQKLVPRLTSRLERPDMVRLGSVYGGWWVPSGVLAADSICYLAGVGEDVTFDLALIERFGCDVWSMDPTPRAIEHAAKVRAPGFHFLPVGVWGEDSQVSFYAPIDPSHVSHSATNIQRTSLSFVAPCKRVSTLMDELGQTRIDLLKLDIEGAEVAVLADLLANGPLPTVLCVEFDQPEAPWRTVRRVHNLQGVGYRRVYSEGRNHTFLLNPEVRKLSIS